MDGEHQKKSMGYERFLKKTSRNFNEFVSESILPDFSGIISDDLNELRYICRLMGIPSDGILSLEPSFYDLGDYVAPSLKVLMRAHDRAHHSLVGRRAPGEGPGMHDCEWCVMRYDTDVDFHDAATLRRVSLGWEPRSWFTIALLKSEDRPPQIFASGFIIFL